MLYLGIKWVVEGRQLLLTDSLYVELSGKERVFVRAEIQRIKRTRGRTSEEGIDFSFVYC